MALRSYTGKQQLGFAVEDCFLQLSAPASGYTTLEPRFSTDPGRSWRFTTSGDYSPGTAGGSGTSYADFTLTRAGQQAWFSRVASGETDNMPNGNQGDLYETSFQNNANMISFYANIHVGDAPHPYSNPPTTRIAILQNYFGAYHQFQTTGSPTPNYSEPRVWNNEQRFQNYAIRGQSWGITNYDDYLELSKGADFGMGIGVAYIRIINLGPVRIHVNELAIYHHGVVDRRV